jgi:hypothetical protein
LSDSHWRNSATPIIARVIAEHKGESESEIRMALRAAYPFGERKHHPYKIWLDECAVQLGKKLPPDRRGPAAKAKRLADTFALVADLFAEETGS